jgi:hypothetical protein
LRHGYVNVTIVSDFTSFATFTNQTNKGHLCVIKVELPAGAAAYLAYPQAKFLSGRYMSSNWDVDELQARKDEIAEKNLLKIDLRGEFGSNLFE